MGKTINKKAKKLIIVGILLIASIIGFFLYRGFAPFKLSVFDHVEKTWKVSGYQGLEAIAYCETNRNSTCLVIDRNKDYAIDCSISKSIIPGDYIAVNNFEGTGYLIYNWKEQYEWEAIDYSKFEINIYNIKTKSLVKTINLLTMMKNYSDYYIANLAYNTSDMNHGGKNVIVYRCDYIYGNWYEYSSTKKYLVVDIDTEEYELVEPERFAWESDRETMFAPEVQGIYDYFAKRGVAKYKINSSDTRDSSVTVGSSRELDDSIEISLDAKELPEDMEKLYQMFPDLKSYRGKDGYDVMLWMSVEDAREVFLAE